ncbi:TraR/DksA family transcriptional regulator [Cupriavidus metallidurans]|uniref:TraR/DksA family transcriptional regulator n=1 Tax=Cupriavidus metallidurans TaxID=119219 RepID=UPI001CC929F9|nr:TraR/DksA C4-type zinc finger protein [Cupriavidus metallidurans]UBM11037.1 TraR/DksA family transcriptional regulator [Cupriavidus metallidurans]
MSKLTAQELTSAAAQLDAEEAHVQAAIRSFATRMPPAALHEPRDESDLADEEVMRQQDDAMRDHYRMRLADIDAARARMQRGQYGICIDCGGAIPFLRLQAYPTAKRCTECQRRREHLYARDAERLLRGT